MKKYFAILIGYVLFIGLMFVAASAEANEIERLTNQWEYKESDDVPLVTTVNPKHAFIVLAAVEKDDYALFTVTYDEIAEIRPKYALLKVESRDSKILEVIAQKTESLYFKLSYSFLSSLISAKALTLQIEDIELEFSLETADDAIYKLISFNADNT